MPTSNDNKAIYRTLTPHEGAVKTTDNEGVLEGYPIVFNTRTQIGDFFTEEIDPHALDNADLSDIVLNANHNDIMLPIARHRRGKRSTMDVSIDNVGVFMRANLDLEGNATAREVYSTVKREDVTDMSFAFFVEADEWQGLDSEMPHRIIKRISKVVDFTVATRGAYPQTSIYARSAALDNAKSVLEMARTAAALDNEKRAESAQAALQFAKQKYLFLERSKKL